MTDGKLPMLRSESGIPRRIHKCLFYDGPAFIYFNNNPEAAEHVIRVILDRDDLHVISSVGQHVISKLDTHDIRCDVLAEDDQGTPYDIEIQQVDYPDLLKRADYYGAMMKVDRLNKGEGYASNREVYVIFIIKKGNVWCKGKHVRSFRLCDDDGEDMNIGTRVYFVNGELIDDTKVGRLVQSFHCENADEMQDEAVAKRYREIKETLDQEDEMDDYDRMIYELGMKRGETRGLEEGKARGLEEGKARGLEEGKVRGLEEGKASIVQNMLRMKRTIQEIAALLGLSEVVVQKYADMKLDDSPIV